MQHDLFLSYADWHDFVVANEQIGVIGFCLFTITNINRSYNTSPMIHIDDLIIKPACRQYGLGKRLLAAVGNIAKQCGIDRLELWCLKDNSLGQLFYEKMVGEKLDYLDVYCLAVDNL